MKRLLLGTTAVVGASMLAAAAVQAAEAPTMKLGGFTKFYYGFVPEDHLNTATREFRDYSFRHDVEVYFLGSAKADNGLEYGVYIEFDVGQTESTTGAPARNVVDEANAFIQSPALGRIELGENDGAANIMAVALPKSWGTGGADGDYDDWILGPVNKIVGNDFDLGDDSKITYLSPKFSGFDFGMSFTPKSTFEGEDVNRNAATAAAVADARVTALGTAPAATRLDEIQAAVRYVGKFQNVDLQVGVAYIHASNVKARAASANTDLYEDWSGWNPGIKLSYGGFTIGGSYLNQGDSGLLKAGTYKSSAKSWAAGIEYKTGPWIVGVNWMKEQREGAVTTPEDEKADAYAAGFTYNVAPGFNVIGEVVFFKLTDDVTGATTNKNEGTAVIVGSQINF